VVVDILEPPQTTDARDKLIHREMLQLVVLIGAASAAFFVTRAIAANNQEMNLRDAAEWYQRGERQLAAGDADRAIDSFQRATAKNRNEKQYVLALARALASTRHEDAARRALLELRELAPEDPDVNLQLARLAAARQDVTEAIRYYHNALYAAWPIDEATGRRQVRLELIRFLLSHDQRSRAESELVALSTDLPNDAAAHVEAGQLFVSAGDNGRALEQFQRAVRLAPDNGAALAGAGQAAFQLGDYGLAQKYLGTAPDSVPGVTESREFVELVLSNDPLAPRIGTTARRRRLTDDLNRATQRLAACLEAGGPPAVDQITLRDEATAMERQLARSRMVEEDTIEAGLELISRIERAMMNRCAPSTPLDRAMILIAQHYGVSSR
jgi:tetratricopeptide (TPR) repeat protein